jgi:hypothetical protein
MGASVILNMKISNYKLVTLENYVQGNLAKEFFLLLYILFDDIHICIRWC